MSARNTHELVEKLAAANIINTKVTLAQVLDVVKGANLEEPWDTFCGTMKHAFVIVRRASIAETNIQDIAQLAKNVKEFSTR